MNRTAVEEIKQRIPIEELVGSYVKLEKAGKSFKAKCPFHNEKSASFFISPERGGYYCFGCGAKGDIFSFVEQFEGLDFRGALKVLAERAGVQLTHDHKADSERDQLYQAMEAAAAYFEEQFMKTGDAAAAEARAYVKGRGISDDTRASFRIGWAPEGWRNLYGYLKEKGLTDGILERAGLIKRREETSGSAAGQSGFYDRFRGRVMFPISDSSGRVIAFSGRILKDDGKSAKYLNSPDTPLYDKSQVLYGLDKAKSEIRRLGYSIMVEGQMDLVMSHQAGIRNAVAASGTALTDESIGRNGAVSNLGLVRRLSPNIIIAFDSDAPGRKAALRAAGIALSLGMDAKIADLVGGKDPADLVREDPESWKNALRSALHVVEFEVGSIMKELGNASDARKIAKALQERVYPLILSVPSRSDREHFVKLVRDKAQMTREEVIWEDLRVLSERREKEQAASSAAASAAPSPAAATRAPMSGELPSRLDLVERRMFGLLSLMEAAGRPTAENYRSAIRAVAAESYEPRLQRIMPLMSDISFEAEAFYGAEAERWDLHMKELISNFEEDLTNDELVAAMQSLKTAEKEGNQERVAELAQKCQVLSIRKAEIARKRHSQ